MTEPLSRRRFLGSLAAWALTPPLWSCAGSEPAIRVQGLNHLTLLVSDPRRSLAFYRDLFGMPVQARQGATPCLRIGDGPQFLALGQAGPGARPGIHHLCMSVEGFEAGRLMHALDRHGVAPAEPGRAGASGGALHARVRMRDAAHGGAPEGTPELYLGDPDGIVLQLQDPRYCGGAGALGERCDAAPPPAAGLLPARGIHHFTLFVSNAQHSIDFYQRVFGLPITKHQGGMPLLDVGPGGQLLGFVDAPGAGARPFIHHACLTIDDFEHERVFAALERHGLTRRDDPLGGPIEPLSTYVTLRMPDRGGAPEGTPELYFSDPDGILIQIQDTRYCAGAGYLGDVCAYL